MRPRQTPQDTRPKRWGIARARPPKQKTQLIKGSKSANQAITWPSVTPIRRGVTGAATSGVRTQAPLRENSGIERHPATCFREGFGGRRPVLHFKAPTLTVDRESALKVSRDGEA